MTKKFSFLSIALIALCSIGSHCFLQSVPENKPLVIEPIATYSMSPLPILNGPVSMTAEDQLEELEELDSWILRDASNLRSHPPEVKSNIGRKIGENQSELRSFEILEHQLTEELVKSGIMDSPTTFDHASPVPTVHDIISIVAEELLEELEEVDSEIQRDKSVLKNRPTDFKNNDGEKIAENQSELRSLNIFKHQLTEELAESGVIIGNSKKEKKNENESYGLLDFDEKKLSITMIEEEISEIEEEIEELEHWISFDNGYLSTASSTEEEYLDSKISSDSKAIAKLQKKVNALEKELK